MNRLLHKKVLNIWNNKKVFHTISLSKIYNILKVKSKFSKKKNFLKVRKQ
jgi:hypothetical protein